MIRKIKKILPRKKKEAEKLPTRITNDTVAEHREKVLAGGRKLKYPLQYTRRKLVRNTILISFGAAWAGSAAAVPPSRARIVADAIPAFRNLDMVFLQLKVCVSKRKR